MSLAFRCNTNHDLNRRSLPDADTRRRISSFRGCSVSEFVNNHRSLQQVLCLLICVCAWRGPVPVLHDHDAVRGSELQIRHAQAFHNGQRVDEIIGLHWHLGFPEDITGEKCPPRDEAAPELSLFASTAAVSSCEISAAASLQLKLNVLTAPYVVSESDEASSSSRGLSARCAFLQTLLSELPLSAVTGVCVV